MPDNGFTVVLRTNIDALGDKVATVHMLFPHTSLAFLESRYSFFLNPASLFFLFAFSSSFKACNILLGISANSEKR